MRKHEWETLTKIYSLAERIAVSLETIAGALAPKETTAVTTEEKPKVTKRSRKTKESPKENLETKKETA